MEPLVIFTIICAASIPLAASSQRQNGDLRLYGHGHSQFAGRLEVFYDGEWGSVCASGVEFSDFDFKAGSVACRQMGLGNVVDVYSKHNLPELRLRYGEGSGPIFLDTIRCTGYESHLLRCDHLGLGTVSDSCSHNTEVALVCSNVTTPYYGETRLRSLNPSSPERGVVELYSNAQWAAVCYSVDTAAYVANVTCKQLGYTHAINVSAHSISGSHWDISVGCSGSETCLGECLPSLPTTMATGRCDAVVLQCGFDTNLSSSVPSGNLHSCRGDPTNHDGAVRINPPDPDYSYDTLNGIVEIFINGAWGAVCAERTSILEADVICKQLGYPSADSHVPDLFHLVDNQSVYDLECSGLELTIKDCTVTRRSGVCNHGFMTTECSTVVPPYGSLTLRDGSGSSGSRGTLLVYTGEYFQPVCESNFDRTQGEVACRQLGYNSLVEIRKSSYYGLPTSYPDKLNSLLIPEDSCSGQSQHLLSCLSQLSSSPDCRETVDEVVLSCDRGGPDVNVRLVGENAPMSGRLEVYIHNQWGSVCAMDSQGVERFGYLEASIVCRSLDFRGAARGPYHLQRPDSVKTHLESVVCSGFEESIVNCQHVLGGDNCSLSVGIECSDTVEVTDGELRLYGNNSVVNETDGLGRLEISYHGVWMTVCGTYFSQEAAQVACRQLGYSMVVDICRNSSCYGEGEGYIHVAEDMCSGEEERLLDCKREPFTSQFCDHSLDVGLQCAKYIPTATTSATPTSVAPPTSPPLYVFIIIAVSAFVLVVGFVIAVCCCASCCVRKQKKSTKEGTWTSPNHRNGRAAFPSGSSVAATNSYVQTTIRNNLHSSDNDLPKKARDQYDDPSDIVEEEQPKPKVLATQSKQPNSPTMPSKRDDSSLSSSPSSHFHEPPSSPVAKASASSSSATPRQRQHHNIYQNVTEIRCTVEEPPPNYDELDDFPPVHNYRVPNSASFSAANPLSNQDELGEGGSGFAERTMDSGIGSTTHEIDIKRDLQLPPLSPDDHETML